ncbi:Crinkler (CRN), partial [Phytophthora megakarya]
MRYQYLDDALKNNTVPCWFVVDGLNYKNLKDMKWFARFTLLATSRQLSVRNESMHFMKMCLLPYWKQDDLQNFGLKYMKMKESDVDARYFVSGGSLTEFLDDDAKPIVHAALKCIATPEDAEKLNSIDRIRMQGVPDRNNVEHYVNIGKWTSCVTSKLALNKLAQMMKSDFFERLMGAARGMNDDRLEGVAFEGHFHTLVRHRRPICVHYCKYDNVDRGASNNWESIMHQDMGSMDWKELKVDCAGENTKECVVVMKSWAANPSKMEYWIPATSLCETIDAVVKWTAPDNHLRFCFLQLTKATKHKCNAAILWELAQPFVNEGLSVCYIA